MDWLLLNPFALWLVIGGILLAVEVGTGSGWLLWPAASAAAMGLLGLVVHFELNTQWVVFAILTIITTLAGRRLFPRAVLTRGDINDTSSRMAGLDGVAAGDFQSSRGRVFVDGKEWAADLEGSASLASGARVVVVGVKGSRLTVKPG